jgi:hypothetical protein
MTPTGGTPIDAIGLLRQLVYLPNASVAVAEAGRQIVGGAILGLRPSVRAGGFVGTIDLLAVGDCDSPGRVADLLIEEMLLSARRKGCASVEVVLAGDAQHTANWSDHGFTRSTADLYRAAIPLRAQASR